MIYFDEEKGGWAFDKITELEKEKVYELGQKYFMPNLAVAVFDQLAEQDQIDELAGMEEEAFYRA